MTKVITENICYLVKETGLWVIQFGAILEKPCSRFHRHRQPISSSFLYIIPARTMLNHSSRFLTIYFKHLNSDDTASAPLNQYFFKVGKRQFNFRLKKWSNPHQGRDLIQQLLGQQRTDSIFQQPLSSAASYLSKLKEIKMSWHLMFQTTIAYFVTKIGRE